MRAAVTLLAFALTLGACAPSADQGPAPVAPAAEPPSPTTVQPRADYIPTQEQVDRFLAEGKDPALREIAAVDYYLHYRLMQATGIEKELGGEQQAIKALQALGDAYESRVRGVESEVPKIRKIAYFTGEGMLSGFTGMGLGGFVGLLTGGMTSGMVGGMSDAELAAMSSKGPWKFEGKDSKAEMTIGKDGSVSQQMAFDVNTESMNGKVKLKTRMTACPDVNGKLEVEIDVDSQMTVKGKDGTGGSVHSTFKYERYLNDDAELIQTADGAASSNHVRMSGIENFERQYVDLTIGRKRGGERVFEHHDEGGYSIFRPDEVGRTMKVLESVELLQTLVGEAMLRGFVGEPPYASGRCIDLKVTSNPAKRTGLEPATPFQIEAKPRVKADGSPAQGTVRATLSGGSKLTLDGIKIKADSTHAYVGPEEKEQVASIKFESRSKRGIGKTELSFDTKNRKRAYSIDGGADEFHGTGEACDLEELFVVTGSGVTVRFVPASAEGGRYSYSGSMSGFAVWGNGTYTVNYQGETAVSISATGPGSVKTPQGTHTRNGSETYTLTPLGDKTCVPPTEPN